ncbi:TRAP transporter small permease [Leptospira interrogans]
MSEQPSAQVLDRVSGWAGALRFALGRFEGWFAGTSMFLCLVVVSAEIFLRGVLNISLQWSEELARYLLIWTTYWGAAAATADNAHIRVEFLVNLLGRKARLWVEVAILLSCAAGAAVFAWYGYGLVEDSRLLGLTSGDSNLAVPIWIFQSVIPIAFALMSIRLLLSVFHIIRFGELPKPEDELILEV